MDEEFSIFLKRVLNKDMSMLNPFELCGLITAWLLSNGCTVTYCAYGFSIDIPLIVVPSKTVRISETNIAFYGYYKDNDCEIDAIYSEICKDKNETFTKMNQLWKILVK